MARSHCLVSDCPATNCIKAAWNVFGLEEDSKGFFSDKSRCSHGPGGDGKLKCVWRGSLCYESL